MAISGLIFDNNTLVSFEKLDFFNYLLIFIVGIVAAGTMVIPGISGSLVLMLLGYYYPVINTINEFFKFNNMFHNFTILLTFGLGILVGIVGISKILELLFKNYKTKTYFGVFGFVIASVIAIPISSMITRSTFDVSILEGFASICTIVIGFIISYELGEKYENCTCRKS